jgi:hypothetical protein
MALLAVQATCLSSLEAGGPGGQRAQLCRRRLLAVNSSLSVDQSTLLFRPISLIDVRSLTSLNLRESWRQHRYMVFVVQPRDVDALANRILAKYGHKRA